MAITCLDDAHINDGYTNGDGFTRLPPSIYTMR
jgi:hypothetical protein